jgi:two-component system, sensor histidine kinase PdtaS
VLEYLPDERRLMERAGVGWLRTPSISFLCGRHWIASRIRIPDGADRQIKPPEGGSTLPDASAFVGERAINALIEKGGEEKSFFGVLEVDSADPGQFDQADADFLVGFAGLLGIDRTPAGRRQASGSA